MQNQKSSRRILNKINYVITRFSTEKLSKRNNVLSVWWGIYRLITDFQPGHCHNLHN